MTTRPAVRALRRYLKARVPAVGLPGSYTIRMDTTAWALQSKSRRNSPLKIVF